MLQKLNYHFVFYISSVEFVYVCVLAQIKFVASPPSIVYIPPTDSPVKTVRCITNVTASITWVHNRFKDLDPITFNITEENSTSSIMLVHQSLAEANVLVFGTLITGSIVCQAGTTDSVPFTFRLGSEKMFMFNIYSFLLFTPFIHF